jgi:hypothetical protein
MSLELPAISRNTILWLYILVIGNSVDEILNEIYDGILLNWKNVLFETRMWIHENHLALSNCCVMWEVIIVFWNIFSFTDKLIDHTKGLIFTLGIIQGGIICYWWSKLVCILVKWKRTEVATTCEMGEYIQEYISITIDMKTSCHVMTSLVTFNYIWIADNIIRSGYVMIVAITLDFKSWEPLKYRDEDMLCYHQVLLRLLYYNQS